MPKNIIVIGSGFGGLAAAIRLQARGHKVKLFEKRDKLGGRAYVYEQNGFKFDGGPTIVTAPFLFDEIWQAAGKRREDDVTFVKCDPFYRIFDHNKRVFNYNDDEMYILEQIHNINPEDKRGYLNFIHSTRAIFDKGFTELADKPFLNFTDMLKVAPDLIRLQSYLNVYPYVSKFIKDPFLRQCFSFHPLLIGGNPYDSSSIYAMIHYLERKWGVWYAMGGTGAIVTAMGKLFESIGGEIFLNSEVSEILAEDGRVQGIRLKDGTEHRSDDVVSNADVAWTYKKLIPEAKRKKYTDSKVDSLKYSMSLFVIYFGTRKQYRDQGLAHHNIILGPRYKGLLDDIFHKKVVAQDFSLYLHMPSLTDPSMAPEGGESFYVLSPVPHLGSGTDWTTFAKEYRDRIMKFLEDNYLPGLQENLVAEHHIDPLHFQDELNSHLGAAFSVEPVLTQSAWFRPHNRSEDFSNLYFVGAGTHPGAGLPGVLSSAKIAEDLICD
ncbi:phytoene desaturase [Deinococcus cellulosilyticus]|uniref:Phytoene dehydrogenase n=1 Tax=Deinococcus cellulosilyticus (strain DSM 18568 / NBRC 106333 / KACC 11606 / 5516J-15) TaxID=1223518 RepID=A0A511MWC8_DEIC1|nr:phytoene desaturase [Deinococcus cellulosilyticus]GEM44885.1 phytoene desaturase [Deinococcus cellulosilyticus NBRC 106333 = KACC 11606]